MSNQSAKLLLLFTDSTHMIDSLPHASDEEWHCECLHDYSIRHKKEYILPYMSTEDDKKNSQSIFKKIRKYVRSL